MVNMVSNKDVKQHCKNVKYRSTSHIHSYVMANMAKITATIQDQVSYEEKLFRLMQGIFVHHPSALRKCAPLKHQTTARRQPEQLQVANEGH